jgi:flagellar basal-body rod modification protein FlgD
MADTTPITSTGATQSANKTQLAQQVLNSNFSQFLRLLTTQLQNQDPLNPMDSAQFTQQLVMYSQVEQQLATNTKLDNLTSLTMNSSLSLALGYVGKDITYTSAELNFDGATPVDISYNLTEAATSATMNILDDEGNVVYTTTVSDTTGLNKVTWDGTTTQGPTAESGTYSIQLVATDETGNTSNITTAVTGLVRGIENQDGVPNLLVGDRAVPLDIVINASTPPPPATTGT